MYPRRVWHVRTWIRVAAALAALGAVALVPALAQEAAANGGLENPVIVIPGVAFVITVVPWLAWWPVLVLEADGSMRVRGWAGIRRSYVSALKTAGMTPYGLRLEFEGLKPLTCQVFQATRAVDIPRFAEVFEALSALRVPSRARRAAAARVQPTDRVPDALLFRSHPATQWRKWLTQLRYFRAVTAAPGEGDGDKFVLTLRCRDIADLQSRLLLFDLKETPLAFLEGRVDDARFVVLLDEVPHPALRFVVSGADGSPYEVGDRDVAHCLTIERRIDELGWQDDVDLVTADHFAPAAMITRERYPELF